MQLVLYRSGVPSRSASVLPSRAQRFRETLFRFNCPSYIFWRRDQFQLDNCCVWRGISQTLPSRFQVHPPMPPPMKGEQIVQWLVANPGLILATWLALCAGFIYLLVSGLREANSRNQDAQAADAAGKPKRVMKEYTKEQVAQHKSPEDCWIILDGKVYDVSSYVEEHPGGDSILRNAGGDSTTGFHGPQHPVRVFDIVDDFCIGTLVPSGGT